MKKIKSLINIILRLFNLKLIKIVDQFSNSYRLVLSLKKKKIDFIFDVGANEGQFVEELIKKIQFRIKAVLRAKQSRYILLNAPNDKIDEISSILPVLKSPTVLPLAQEGWSSLHSVIDAHRFWEVIDELKAAGAEDILVCPIEKMVL